MAHPNALRSILGHAASIGGAAYVERAAFSDGVMGKLMEMDAASRKTAHAVVSRALDKAKASPRPSPREPSPRERVKIRWTDELIARFKATAPWVKNNKALAVRLGLPEYCAGAMKRARTRYLQKADATVKPSGRRQIESPAADLKRAA